MKNIKKVILVITMIVLSSCTWRNAQSAFDKGRYLDSVSLTMDYLNGKDLAKLKPEDQKTVVDRLNYIENIYQSKISQESERKYLDLLDYWKILYLIDKNPSVVKSLDKNRTQIENPYIFLKQAIDKINAFSGYNQRETLKTVLNSLVPTTRFIKNNIKSDGYIILISEYYKSIANIYNRLGNLEENAKNYEGAKQAYYNSYEIYKDYSSNYNNNYDNYIRIDKQLIAEKARLAIQKANEFVIKRDYVKAVPNYKEALALYNRYSSDFKSQINDLKYNLNRAEENVKYQLAEEAYQKASDIILRANNKNDYQRAIDLFKEASRQVYDYKDSQKLADKYTQLIKEVEKNPFKQETPQKGIIKNTQQQIEQTQSQFNNTQTQVEQINPVINQEIPNYQSGEVRRDTTDIKNYLAISMLNINKSPYDANYRETVKYDKNVTLVNSKNSIATEYVVTESIVVSPIITFQNGRVAYNTYKYENRYREYVYNNGIRRISGKAYGPEQMLENYKQDIDQKIKNLIKESIR